jgi:voltage-gated potassium channel
MTIRKHIDTAISASGLEKIVRGLILLGMVLMVGTMGYMIIERWQLMDALYMTVITITTVGFKEVSSVSEPGRVFTVILIFVGMGIMAYTLGMVAQFMVEGEIRSILGRKKLGSRIKSLKKHYIVCGYGRIGRIIAQELKSNGIPILVIDSDPESQSALDQNDMPYIIDDATSEDVLIEAGIERAKGLVAVVLSDADNLFLTMTARGLKPDLYILARADEEQSQKKLLRAGADNVVLPYLMGGRKMAQTILRPAVADFLDLTIHDKDIELNMEGLKVKEVSTLNGVTLLDSGIRQKMNVIIVAIRKKDGEMMFNPSFEARIEAGDTLIALGQSSELDRLAFILAGK